MATLYIRWFQKVAVDDSGNVLAAGYEGGKTQDETVSLSASSAQSAAAPGWARFVELHTDTICHYGFGDNPTASTSNMRMPADLTVFKGVKPGIKVAARTGS